MGFGWVGFGDYVGMCIFICLSWLVVFVLLGLLLFGVVFVDLMLFLMCIVFDR